MLHMLKITIALLPVIVLAYDHRPYEVQAAMQRAAHPDADSMFQLAKQVVEQLQDYERWLSHIATKSLSNCTHLQNCANSTNVAVFFKCLAADIQLIIKDCLPPIQNPDPHKLFDVVERWLQRYLRNSQQISAGCSADLSYSWVSLMEFATAGAILATQHCEGQTNASDNCNDLRTWAAKALRESVWALIPIDASAKIPPGYFDGNFHWDGSLKQCKSINQHSGPPEAGNHGDNSTAMTTSNPIPNAASTFPTLNKQNDDEIVTTMEPTNSGSTDNCNQQFKLSIATCMPDSCSNVDVKRAVDTLTFNALSKLNVLCDAQCVPNVKKLPKAADTIVWLLLAAVTAAIALFGTCYDYCVYNPQLKAAENPNIIFDRQPTFGKVLLAFSLYSNVKRLLEMEKRSGQVHCLHGIRCLSMTWVICGHVYINVLSGDNVRLALVTIPKQFINLAIINASPSVDTFFLLSGFLLCYLWFKEIDRSKGKKLKSPHFWIMYYVHRYLRLTPLLAIIVWGSVSVFPYIAEGAFYQPSQDAYVQFCRDSWWATLLYFNNVYKPDMACYGVTWYLSNDMQFYIVAPIVMALLYSFPLLGLGVCGFLIAAVVSTTAWITVDHDFPPGDTITAEFGGLLATPDYFRLMYVPPWTRYGPYVVGLLLGFILYKLSLKKRPVKMSRWIALIGWLLAAGVCSAVIFGLFNYTKTGQMSLANRAFYSAVHRTAWALGVAWVIFACHTGYGGVVDRLLSWSIFIPLSRLTYAAYLVHPTLNLIYFGTLEKSAHWDDHFHWTTLVMGIVIWSYMIAIPFSCLFELPILTLEKVLFHPPQIDSKPKTQNGVTPNGLEEYATLKL